MMPRSEFEKMEKILNKKKIADNLSFISYDNGNMHYPFGKIINTNIKIDESCIKDKLEQFLWIDIFPMDGIPENERECKKLYRKTRKYRRLLLILYAEDSCIENFSKTKLKKIIKKIMRMFIRKKHMEKISKKFNEISKTYDFNNSKYVGGVSWGYGPQEKLLKKDIHDSKEYIEGIKVNTKSRYEKNLTNKYGDYMKLPPVEKRITHDIKVYRIGE